MTKEEQWLDDEARLVAGEKRLGYFFKDRALLLQALCHSSHVFEKGGSQQDNNETLEFIGDAVLDLVVGHLLFRTYPEMDEGELTRLRAALVQESHLAVMARVMGLGSLLYLGRGEDNTGGRDKPSLLSCAFEAVFGAIFVDGGYEVARQVAEVHLEPWLDQCRAGLLVADPKSRLQEILQERHGEGPLYQLEGSEGPEHAKTFHVTVGFQGQVMARGPATSKKEAEQQAAAVAVRQLMAEA